MSRKVAYWALWGFVFSIPWENVFTFPGWGTATKAIGITAIGLGWANIILKKKLRWHFFHTLGVLFILWNWTTSLWALDVKSSITRNITYTGLWLITLIIYNIVDNSQDFYPLAWGYILGSWIAAVGLIVSGVQVYHRYTLEGFNPNDFSFYLLFGVPLAWHIGNRSHRKIQRVIAWGMIPVALTSIVLTGSRSGVVAGAITALFILVSSFSNFKKSLLKTSALFAAFGVLVTNYTPQYIYAYLSTLPQELFHGTLDYRLIIWKAGIRLFSYTPLKGVGSGNFTWAVGKYLYRPFAPHNAFLGIAVETGVLGLLLWIGMLVAGWQRVLRTASPARLLWATEFIILLIALMTQNFEWKKTTWLFTVLALSYSRIPHQRQGR